MGVYNNVPVHFGQALFILISLFFESNFVTNDGLLIG